MARPLVIVQMLPALDAGGVERGTLEMAEAIVAAGHRAVVISAGGRLLPRLLALGAEHVALDIGSKNPWSLRHVFTLRRLWTSLSADIVHARSRWPAWLAWLAWRGMDARTRPRFMTTVHGLNSVNAYSAIMTRGETVICVSQAVRDYVLRHYPDTNAARLRVIHRGVDEREFPHGHQPGSEWLARQRSAFPALQHFPDWLCLAGRGTRMKGHTEALRLLSALARHGRPVALVLPGVIEAGRETYERELRAEAQRLGVLDRVVFLPAQSDVRDWMSASRMVLQLSRKPEAFGRTVVEALQLGVPVLGFDHAGVGEQLRDLFPAGAVPLDDDHALLTRAIHLLDQPQGPAPFDRYRTAHMQQATLAEYRALAAAPR